MKIQRYIILYLAGLFLFFTACSNDDEKEVSPDEVPIMLSGIGTRSDGINGANIYLKAFLAGPPEVYFNETLISFSGGLSSILKDVIFPGAKPFYPLNDQTINFIAYSGKAQGDYMVLTAGFGATYDAVLSNYGKRSLDPGVNKGYEGLGTPGSSTAPAEILQFRHVMTQVNVSVEVDETEQPVPVDPKPSSVHFTMNGVVSQGTYPIRASEPDPANEASAVAAIATNSQPYTLRLGTNYLVPTGEDLRGKQLNSLIIDDYTATAGDLTGFTIQPVSGDSTMKLLPGYAYDLTLTVRRLRVTGIKITPVHWHAEEITGNEVSYTPNILTLSLGSNYQNSGDDAITKVVLHSSDGKMYVGESSEDQAGIEYVLLPAQGTVDRAELYTSKGLLLSSAITTEYQNNTLTLDISEGGMVPENPSQPYGENNPYLITTPVQFMNVSKDLTGYYKQGVIIDLQALNLIGNDRIFNGFGDFSGVYDGNGYFIAAVDIVGPGLFKSNSGILKNIRIFSGTMDVSGEAFAGSLCGVNSGTIVACFNEAMVTNSTATVGGICGLNDVAGTIIGCINTGNVLQGSVVGGICGANNNMSTGAIAACILTGMLNHQADNLGGISGISQPSPNQVIRRGFGLVGCAQKYLGGPELAVDSENVGTFDCSALEPDILRNGLHEGDGEDRRIVNRLNDELENYTSWGDEYHFIIDRAATGITWPAPVKK